MPYFPQTKIRLLDVPFDADRKHTLDFANITAQYNYFTSRVQFEYNNVSYQRKPGQPHGFIRMNKHFDSIQNCNYVMYQNTDYGSKWFYAFIIRMEYQNENCTDIYLDFDAFQSWLFDHTLKASYVEREMILNDTEGNNIVEESLELGEYVYNLTGQIPFDSTYIVIGCTVDLMDDNFPSLYGSLQLIASGLSYYAFAHSSGGFNTLKTRLKLLDESGKADAVQVMWIVPANFIEVDNYKIVNNASAITEIHEIQFSNTANTLDGYAPRNKKLLTSPFRQLYISNNSGGAETFRLEWFRGTPSFTISSTIAPNSPIIIYPNNYTDTNRFGGQPEYAMEIPSLPQVSWASNAYSNWLAQNSASLSAERANIRDNYNAQRWQQGANIADTALSILQMKPFTAASGIAHGFADLNSLNAEWDISIRNLNAKKTDASIQPPQSRGQSGSSAMMLKPLIAINNYICTIKAPQAERLDQYFDMFGYQTNLLKIPNVNNRPNWNYIKTAYCNITGSIPNSDIDEIRARYNNGMTRWHNPATMYDYSQSNT